MNIAELLAISLALAVDAATYAFSYGLVLRQRRAVSALLLALAVGVFQAGMPLLGYMGGLGLRSAVQTWGHWMVLGIFCALGISVIWKAWRGEESVRESQPLGAFGLLVVGLATSMDAFAVGICMALGDVIGRELSPTQLGLAVGVIGLVTFISAEMSFHLSRLMHRLPERFLQSLAGALLIFLGLAQLMR